MRIIGEQSSSRTLRVYTTPVIDTTAYEVIRDTIHRAALEDPGKEVKGGMALAFARALSEREISPKDYVKQANANYYFATPWNQLEGRGISTKPPGAFTGINGRFRNNPQARVELEHELIESQLDELMARLPQARLNRFKELFRTSYEDEKEALLQRFESQDPVIVRLFNLENQFETRPEAKTEFDQILREEGSRIKSEAPPELVTLLHQVGNHKLLEDPNELWTAVVRNLHEQELLQPPHQWDVTDENLDNISWITRRNFETLATVEERPNPFKLNSRTIGQDGVNVRNLIAEVQALNEVDRQKLILAPNEIIAVAKPFYSSYKEDGVIKGNPLSYDSEQNRFHLYKVSEIDSQIALLGNQSALSEEDKGTIERLKQERSHHKAEAKRYEESFLQKIELDSGWEADGTRIIPGIEGVKFLRAKDHPEQANQEVTDPQELNGRILRREIQALSYHQENHDSGKLISFLTKAKEYLSQQGFSNEQITHFLDIYSQSLEYYGKGLPISSDGEEHIIGGHGQISFAVAQITNLSQGSPMAREIHRCIESTVGKTLTLEQAQTELLKLSPQQLEDLRAEFYEQTGVDLIAFEPETAVFGEDGSEYRPRQPHDKKDPVNIVDVEISNDTGTQTAERNQIVIRDVRGSFVEPKKRSAQKELEKEGLDEQKDSNPMHHFFGRTSSAIKDFYDWAVGKPRLSPADKRQRAAEEAINRIISLDQNIASREEILGVLFKGLVSPLYLSFAEKEFFNIVAMPIILETFNAKDLRRFKRDQLVIQNNVFSGIQGIDQKDTKSLNTQALIHAVLQGIGGGAGFASDLKLTAEGDLEILHNRYKFLREGIANLQTKNSAFFTEERDSINYYAGHSQLLDTLEGRLRLVLDAHAQWSDWVKIHQITDHRDKVGSLHISPTTQGLFTRSMRAVNAEGSKLISTWMSQNLSIIANKSINEIIDSLPVDVRRALEDDQKLAEFVRGEERYTEALLTALEKRTKLYELVDKFGQEQIKEFLDITLDPLGAESYWSVSHIAHWLQTGEELSEVPRNSKNILALPEGFIQIENGEMKINLKASNGKNYKIPKESQAFLDNFLVPAYQEMRKLGYEPPNRNRREDNVTTQLNLLSQKYASANSTIEAKVREARKRGNYVSQEEICNIRFQVLAALEMRSQFIQKRYPITSELDFSNLPEKQRAQFAREVKSLGNVSEIRSIIKFIEDNGELCMEQPLDDLAESDFKQLVQKYCSDRNLFNGLMKYLEKLTQMQIKEVSTLKDKAPKSTN